MALPRLSFNPVIEPYIAPPIEELGSTVGVLRQDYETALQEGNRARQAIATARAMLPSDQARLEQSNASLMKTLQEAEKVGDYENQLTNFRRALGQYTTGVAPILQNNQLVQQSLQRAQQEGADVGRVRNYLYSLDRQNPFTFEQDGYVSSRFDPSIAEKVIAPPVNITNELIKIGDAVKPEISTWASTGKIKYSPEQGGEFTIPTLVNGKTVWVKEDEVRPLLEARLKETDIQRYLNAERELTQSEIYSQLLNDEYSQEDALAIAQERSAKTISNIIDRSVDPVTNAFAYKNILRDHNQLKLGDNSSGGGPEDPLIYSISNGEMFQAVDADLGNLSETIADLENVKNSTPDGKLPPELEAQYSQLKELQDSAFKEVEKNIDFSSLYGTYAKARDKFGDQVDNEFLFDSQEEFTNALRDPTKFGFANNNAFIKMLSRIDENNPPTEVVAFRNAFNDYWDIVKDVQDKIKVAKSPMIITALNDGKYSNQIGAINDNLTTTFRTNKVGYNLLLSGESIHNSDHLREKYGTSDDSIEIGNREFESGRDPNKDILSIGGTTHLGKPVLQLTIRNKEGEILGSELVTGRRQDGVRQIRKAAQEIYRDDPQTAIEILANLEILPQIQSKSIYISSPNDRIPLGDLGFFNPTNGRYVQVDENAGFRVSPNKGADGSILGINLYDENNKMLGTFSSEEELANSLYNSLLSYAGSQ